MALAFPEIMSKYPLISHALRTCFNVEHGLSQDVAIRLYVRNAVNTGRVEEYLREVDAALADPDINWKSTLASRQCEVYDADTEEEAKLYAQQILREPLQGVRLKRG
jgi:hypothetical protein